MARKVRLPSSRSTVNGTTAYLWTKTVKDPVTGEYRHKQPTRYMKISGKMRVQQKKSAGGKGG